MGDPSERKPIEPRPTRLSGLDALISECPGILFWTAVYLPVGLLFTLMLNSLAPLIIAVCLGYLSNRSLSR